MRESIRFARGESLLGNFVVAMSDHGIVALEFADDGQAADQRLQHSFREAVIVDDQQGSADIIAKIRTAIDQPGFDPCIPLDLRGTPYQVQIWRMLRDIPVGETTTYGALAAKLGTRDPRDLTAAISANPVAILVPCHRVIKKNGSISGYRWGPRRKRALLARERALAQ